VLEFLTVEEKVYNTNATGLTARQQRLLLRAVVGSLVLSAALAQPAAAQGARPRENTELISVRVDARPFRDLLSKARRMTAAGQLNPSADYFTFTVEAARNPDGTLGGARLTEVAAANGRWRGLTEEFVRVLSDSRALAHLEGVERVTLTVSLGQRFAAELAADSADEARAARHANAFGVLLAVARDSQSGQPGVEVLNNMRVSASGKRLLMKLDMSREEVGNLLSTARAIP
jgi:hypothetical protein